MIYLPSPDFHVNKFVDVKLPTKRQIFARTGQVAVQPSGSYSGDDPVHVSTSKTEQAESFLNAAENFEVPQEQSVESKDSE